MNSEANSARTVPLNAVFSAPCHVAILRALYLSPEPASGRQIARDAEVNHQACADGLRRLESLGLVVRDVQGRTHAFSLNTGHPVVDQLLVPLFRGEGEVAANASFAEEPADHLAPAGVLG